MGEGGLRVLEKWITGRDENAVLASDWRASQLLLGIMSWDGIGGRIDYTFRDEEKVDQSFFITNYFSGFTSSELRAAGCGRRVFPRKNPTKSVLTAMAAIKTTSEGPTLVFTPQKDKEELVDKAGVVVRLLDSDPRITPTIEVQDTGIGIAQGEFPSTILSLNQINKINKWFVMGRFGQGGSATYRFSKVRSHPPRHTTW